MTIYIIIITVIVSIAAFRSDQLYHKLIFNPYQISKFNEWYRFFTSGFLHADWLHLIVNMLVLYQFGQQVEYFYDAVFASRGWYYYLILYLGGIMVSMLPTYKKHKDDRYYRGLGASGAVSAVLFTCIIFNPWEKIYLFGILGLPGIVFCVAYIAYSYYMDKRERSNVNHNAHLWGGLFGMLYTLALKPSLIVYFFNALLSPRI